MKLVPEGKSYGRLLLFGAFVVAALAAGLFVWFRRHAGPPYGPRAALQTIHVDKGFHTDLFVSEPMIKSPVAMDWDENGRIYVAEDTGYPLDTRPIGRIMLLEDTNGDGIPDRSTVFADNIVMPNGVMCWKGGILVSAAPDVWFFKDTKGDGKADVREKVLTGFAFTNPQHMVNYPLYGPDNWIYLAHQGPIHTVIFKDPFGDQGSDIRFADGKGPRLKMGAFSVRFRPDSHELEALSGWSQYGHAFDEWGHHFTITNNSNGRHEVIAERYLRRNLDLMVASPQVDVSTTDNNKVFPITHNPRFEILTDVGTLTSACSITFPYLSGTFPPSFRQVACVAESAHNMVHCDVWSDDGASYTARRLEEGAEFIASTDAWFRPVNMYIGPDGALYLIDYYRNVIEHPEWMAADTYHAGFLYNGQNRGRIYRITPDLQLPLPLPKQIRLGHASDAELVQQLANPNIWWRRTAQRLLVERQAADAVEPLVKLFNESQSPLGRVHALWTLDGLGKLDAELIKKALDDPEAGIRENAVRLAEPRLTSNPNLVDKLVKMAEDPDAKVRLQLLCTLGYTNSPQAKAASEELLLNGVEDRWMQVAALSASSARASEYFDFAAHRLSNKGSKGRAGFFEQVSAVIGMRAAPAEMRHVLTTVAGGSASGSDWWRGAALTGLAHGAQAKGSAAVAALNGNQDLLLGLQRRPGPLGHAALQLLAVIGLSPGPATTEALKRARGTASDRKADAATRADAVGLLALANTGAATTFFEQLIDPGQPDDVQIAAVRALGSSKDAQIGRVLLAKWREMTPGVRAEATSVMLHGGSDRTRLLLEAVRGGDVQTWQLDPYKPRLFMDTDPAVRDLARSLFQQSPAQREQVLKQYQAALNVEGNAARGKEVFHRVCSKCHALDGVGVAVGPNLGTVRNHPSSELLIDIIMPSKAIEQGYETYVVVLNSGDIVDGIMSAHTEATVTLRQEQQREIVVSRDNIRRMYVSNVSMMPEGLEKQVSVDQMADLLAFLKSVR